MSVDPDKVIGSLAGQIANLVTQLAMKDAAIEDLRQRITELEQPAEEK